VDGDSGGNAARLYTDDERENKGLANPHGRCARRLKTPLTIGFALMLLGLASHLAHARPRPICQRPRQTESVVRVGRTMVWPIRGYLGLTRV
jgi:hypothetical protein